MHEAAYKGEVERCKELLIKEHANVNVRTKNNLTPLHRIAMAGLSYENAPTVLLLLQHGATVSTKDNYQKTAAHWIIEEENKVAQLAKKNPYPRELPLCWSLKKENNQLCRAAYGGEASAPTPLLLLLLAAHGVPFSTKDTEGKTPLDYASRDLLNNLAITLGVGQVDQEKLKERYSLEQQLQFAFYWANKQLFNIFSPGEYIYSVVLSRWMEKIFSPMLTAPIATKFLQTLDQNTDDIANEQVKELRSILEKSKRDKGLLSLRKELLHKMQILSALWSTQDIDSSSKKLSINGAYPPQQTISYLSIPCVSSIPFKKKLLKQKYCLQSPATHLSTYEKALWRLYIPPEITGIINSFYTADFLYDYYKEEQGE